MLVGVSDYFESMNMSKTFSRAGLALSLATVTALSGCAAVAFLPSVLSGSFMVASQYKERGVTVKFDEASVQTANANNLGLGVKKLAVVSHTANPMTQGAGVAVHLTEALLQQSGMVSLVSPAQVAKQLTALNINANFKEKTKLDALDDFQALCKAKGADLFVQPIYEQSMGQGSIDGMQAMLSFGFMTTRKDKLAVRLFNCQSNALTEVTGIVEVEVGSKTPEIAEVDRIVAKAIGKLIGQVTGLTPVEPPVDKTSK
jgi:hypothetical protein